MLHQRLDGINALVGTNVKPRLFLTEGKTFRDDIAKLKPYKGTRKENKPWHFSNLTAYLKGGLDAVVAHGIEADDLMAIEHVASNGTTILCSRDKDLKQIPGMFYSWELGHQPQFGPVAIPPEGKLVYDAERTKLTGTGYAWFLAQTLMGDTTDNIPGLPGAGPKKANELLKDSPTEDVLIAAYKEKYEDSWEEHLTEQAQLCWIVRRYNGDGSPQLWHPGLKE